MNTASNTPEFLIAIFIILVYNIVTVLWELVIMNKNRKKILAMALGLLSVGKNLNKESKAMTAVANKEHLRYDISEKNMEQVPNSSSNNNNFNFFE